MPADPPSPRLMQPLRDEHRDLLPFVDRLAHAIDAFLTGKLLPRAEAEDVVLYPQLADMLGTQEATSMMNRDHAHLRRLTEELAALRAGLTGPRLRKADARALRRTLYGLSMLLRLHLEQEEVYLALLDTRLSPEDAQVTFAAPEETTAKAGLRR